jgi:hypothetical protein
MTPHTNHSARRSNRVLLFLIPVLLILSIICSNALPQQTTQDRLERFRKMSVDAETKGLAEPFRGITRNGQIEPGLFALHSTGISTAPVQKAATVFLSALSSDQ